MNLIGIKARKASSEKISTKTKNKVLKDYAKLLDKEKILFLKKILKILDLQKTKG